MQRKFTKLGWIQRFLAKNTKLSLVTLSFGSSKFANISQHNDSTTQQYNNLTTLQDNDSTS